MSVDRLLTAALRAYQDPPDAAQTERVYGTTTTLLTTLNNPLNISLLTSHLLTARAVWDRPDGLRTCLRIVSIFNTAAVHVTRNAAENAQLAWGQKPAGSEVGPEKWARAVAQGADERSSRWKHVLALTGILMGMESHDRATLSAGLRATIGRAVVMAANLALEDPSQTPQYGANAVVLSLAYAFPILSDSAKQSLNCNLLLPAAVGAIAGEEGFQLVGGDFLLTEQAGHDGGHQGYFFEQVDRMVLRPLIENMGPVSRLAAFAVQHATDHRPVLQAQDQLLLLSSNLLDRWRHTPFSAIDLSMESTLLAPGVLQGPWPLLWRLLKQTMYTVVAILQPIVGRCLIDPHLRPDGTASLLAFKALDILRNLHFVSSRQGADSFQVYVFTYVTSIDILSRYPETCVSFLRHALPPPQQPNSPLPTPLDQAHALFYLNTAEHLPLSLPTPEAEALIIAPATAQLSSPSQQYSLSLPLFEAGHSAILSTLSCPQHSSLTVGLLPFYIDTLLSSFPALISPRQFRLAFKTITQIVSPPFPIAATHPHLAETLLEMLRHRAETASTAPLPPSPSAQGPTATDPTQPAEAPLSEQATLVLSLVDALPYLPLPLVEEWLSHAADALNGLDDPAMRHVARKRFWDMLVSGEMDVERAAVGVAWWGTGGGRERVFGNMRGEAGDQFLMSGALGNAAADSRL